MILAGTFLTKHLLGRIILRWILYKLEFEDVNWTES